MSRVTIKDIARRLHVSTTTISNALNNKPGVSKEARDRIIKMARELGYRPNYLAKGLVSNRSYTIGLIVSSIADPFYPELALGVQDKADELGYTMMLFNTNHSISAETRCIETLKSRGADGIILSTVLQDDPNIELMNEMKIPFVLVNRIILDPKRARKIDSVSLDNYGGAYKAAEHLCRIGYEKIAIIGGNMKSSTAILRTEGALDALAAYGITPAKEWVVTCDYSEEKAYAAAKKMLAKEDRPAAILAQGDNMAMGAREAALEAGLNIPEQLAIIGYDNISTCAIKGIELTTVSQAPHDMGSTGAELLIAKIDQQSSAITSQIVMEPRLIVRNSCGFNLHGYSR
ncbi:LacI family DNA-binding transcriptional regulator [Desulforhopalus singaporensis]|uniref:Transcriptional regulator, LacI family n=1 Tax=Desulforhopalus singaporensis TaxID=91360 RepID=A0A1H0SLF2_9BACT|nr:LacI family DNA-binding transcriptional regulator [Desulforhopalus singaporensis]SDP42547.1 transcriptional regulator, LacI family [Desulforhopalus singaporensis]